MDPERWQTHDYIAAVVIIIACGVMVAGILAENAATVGGGLLIGFLGMGIGWRGNRR